MKLRLMYSTQPLEHGAIAKIIFGALLRKDDMKFHMKIQP